MIDLARRDEAALGDQLELVDQFFHPAEHLALARPAHAGIVGVNGPGGNFLEALRDHAAALAHFFQAHQVAVEVVAVLANRNVKVQLSVDEIWLHAAHVVGHAAGAEQRAGHALRD